MTTSRGPYRPWIEDPDPPDEFDMEKFREGIRKHSAKWMRENRDRLAREKKEREEKEAAAQK